MSPRTIAIRTFSALKVPNYRRYFVGQSISLVGTWMQMTAQAWLVLTLTHSPADLGFIVAWQTLPVLVLGPYGGVIADRVDKRKVMIILQSLMGLQALVLGVLVLTGEIHYFEIAVLAVVLGLNNCFENPIRQAFVLEMVGTGEVRNAVSLNSTLVNAARVVGPAIAGLLIATVGDGWCFIVNALSFVAVVASLMRMEVERLDRSAPTPRARGQLREGLRYVARTRELALPLLMMALIGMLAYEFQVTLPVMARRAFHGGSETFGVMTAAMGVGAVVGGLVAATRGRTGPRTFSLSAAGFGVALVGAAMAPNVAVEVVALAAAGFAGIFFLAMGNTTLQLAATPSMRGRVMALWAVAILGTTPIGGPLVGWIAQEAGARAGLGVGAGACLVAAVIGFVAWHRDAAEPLDGAVQPSEAALELPSGEAPVVPIGAVRRVANGSRRLLADG